MIDLTQEYALTESGEVVSIWYCEDEMREIEQKNGKQYIYYDEIIKTEKGMCQALKKELIIETSDDFEYLDKKGILMGRKTEEEKRAEWNKIVNKLNDPSSLVRKNERFMERNEVQERD